MSNLRQISDDVIRSTGVIGRARANIVEKHAQVTAEDLEAYEEFANQLAVLAQQIKSLAKRVKGA